MIRSLIKNISPVSWFLWFTGTSYCIGLEQNSETCTTIYVYHGGMCSVLAALCVPAHCCKYTDMYLPGAACSQCHTPPMLYVCCAGHALCWPCHVCCTLGSPCLVPRQRVERQQTSVNTCGIIASKNTMWKPWAAAHAEEDPPQDSWNPCWGQVGVLQWLCGDGNNYEGK